jgi:hypothetical protein
MRSLFPMMLGVLAGLAACGGPRLETQTFNLKYLPGNTASLIISPYVYGDRKDAKGLMSYSQSTLTVRETLDNLEKIARVLAQYDHPRPLVRLAFHLIQADGATVTDPAIADVEPTLRKLFRFRGYRMVEEGVFSVREGGVVQQALGAYSLNAEMRRVAGVGDSAIVEISVTLLGRDVRFGTEVGVPAGKTAVLGNIGEDPRGTLILTVRPELISASP